MRPMHSILIVDDEPQVLGLLTAILEKAGYFCRTAESAQSAKMVLAEMPFDLLLTDRDMPGESGLDLIRYTKSRYPQTGAVMVTVMDDPELAKEVLKLGIHGYILKPFANNFVLITVDNALRHHQLELQERLHTKLLEREVAARTKSLDEQLHFLQTLIDTMPVPVYYKDLNCMYMGCNRAFAEIVNLKQESIIGKTAADIHDPHVAERVQKKDLELLKTGSIQTFEEMVLYPDGSAHNGIFHKATFEDINGEISGLVGVMLDVTDLKTTEHCLRVSQEKLRSVMDNLHIGVALINKDMKLLQVNRKMEQWFPRAASETERYCYNVFAENHQASSCKNCPASRVFHNGGETHESIITFRTLEGERILKVFASPIHDEAGKIIAALELFEDVTDKLAIERELQQSQKLEAIGQLAAGIAHEINTPAQYLGSNIDFLNNAFKQIYKLVTGYDKLLMTEREKATTIDALVCGVENVKTQVRWNYLKDQIPKAIEQSQDGISKISSIVLAMKEFSHPGDKEKQLTDLNRLIETTVTITGNEWKYVAEIEKNLDQNLPLARCIPNEIGQVFLNLIVNAVHAITDNINDQPEGKGRIVVASQLVDNQIQISFSDTGCGIPEDIGDKIFDPFFTTKEVGRGTGQGLAISRSVIVDKHQGTLRFETEVGKGTTFIIQLPPFQ
jgi:two-component system NtrC family sensor kinase